MPEEFKLSAAGFMRAVIYAAAIVWGLTAFAMLLGICMLLGTGNHAAGRDIISFWAAGHRLAVHSNPYDEAATLQMEQAEGFPSGEDALIMRNPPYALPLVLPLAAFSLKNASLIWSLMLIAALALSVYLIWDLCGRRPGRMHWLGYGFGPAMICILGGQSSLFALLGLALFLRLHGARPFAAGAALWLCALKPHLFLPFAVVLLLWAIAGRRIRIVAGALISLAAGSVIAMAFDPHIWAHYAAMMRSPNLSAEFIPSIGYLLRRALPPHAAWLQYLPTAVACGWASWFFLRRRGNWDWLHDGALLMLVSVATSPYAWLSDQSVLIPALLVGAYRARRWPVVTALALGSSLIEIAQMVGVNMHSIAYTGVGCFWVAWYVIAVRARGTAHADAESPRLAIASL